MAKTISEIYEELKKAKNNIPTGFVKTSSNRVVENYFVFSETQKIIAYKSLSDVTSEKEKIILKNFDFIQTDALEYLIDSKIQEKKVVTNGIIKDEKNNLIPIWIEKKFLYITEINKQTTLKQKPMKIKDFSPNSEGKINNDGFTLPANWFENSDKFIIENDFSYNILIDTKKKSFKKEEQQQIVSQAAENAVCVLVENKKKSFSEVQQQELQRRIRIVGFNIKKKPNSTYKIMFRMAKQLLEAVKTEQQDLGNFSFTHNLTSTPKKLKGNIDLIKKYFISISDKVKEKNISMDMKKEADRLGQLYEKLAPIYNNSGFSNEDKDFISFYFDANKKYQLVGAAVAPYQEAGEIHRAEDIKFLDLSKTNVQSDKIFKNIRTILYFINSDLIVEELKE